MAFLGALALSGPAPIDPHTGAPGASPWRAVCDRPVADDPRIMRCPSQAAEMPPAPEADRAGDRAGDSPVPGHAR
jgi:hypothetical protein